MKIGASQIESDGWFYIVNVMHGIAVTETVKYMRSDVSY